MFRTSRYNFSVAGDSVAALFNARTGALLRLSGADGIELAEVMCEWPLEVDLDIVPAPLASGLIDGGFLVAPELDELGAIARDFAAARERAPVVLTITTTMDCNLGCYYCYEDRTDDRLANADVPAIVAHAERRVTESSTNSLHVDWYGGEPLLNAEFIEVCSIALQDACARLGISYHASIISNGTEWPEDVEAFLARHRIRQVQISFDGLAANHDKRRRYRTGRKPASGASAFETTWRLVDRLLDHVHVDIRFNIDRDNRRDLLPFLDRAEAAGWFARAFPAVFQPARLAAYSERSDFMRDAGLELAEFDALRARVRERAAGRFLVEESEAPSGIPEPRSWVCAALAHHSDVIGADRGLYRCGLQVGERSRAHSAIDSNDSGQDSIFWATFDPTTRPSCMRCSFLPVCWGGCPKKHLERDEWALFEQSLYWRRNLPRLVAQAAGFDAPTIEYDELDQFRDGDVPPRPARHRLPVIRV